MDNQRNTRLRRYGEGCNEDKILYMAESPSFCIGWMDRYLKCYLFVLFVLKMLDYQEFMIK